MAIARVQLRRLKLKHTWHLTPCLLQIINGRLPTGSTNFDHEGLSGRFRTVRAMPKRHYRPQKFSSCYDFSVKLSLYICSHTDSSCPGC